MGWLGMDWMVVYFMKEGDKVVTLHFSSNLFIHFNCQHFFANKDIKSSNTVSSTILFLGNFYDQKSLNEGCDYNNLYLP